MLRSSVEGKAVENPSAAGAAFRRNISGADGRPRQHDARQEHTRLDTWSPTSWLKPGEGTSTRTQGELRAASRRVGAQLFLPYLPLAERHCLGTRRQHGARGRRPWPDRRSYGFLSGRPRTGQAPRNPHPRGRHSLARERTRCQSPADLLPDRAYRRRPRTRTRGGARQASRWLHGRR